MAKQKKGLPRRRRSSSSSSSTPSRDSAENASCKLADASPDLFDGPLDRGASDASGTRFGPRGTALLDRKQLHGDHALHVLEVGQVDFAVQGRREPRLERRREDKLARFRTTATSPCGAARRALGQESDDAGSERGDLVNRMRTSSTGRHERQELGDDDRHGVERETVCAEAKRTSTIDWSILGISFPLAPGFSRDWVSSPVGGVRAASL